MTSTRRRRHAPPSATSSFFISTIALATLLPSALAQNPPWEVQTFDFGWSPYNSTLTQCRVLDLVWSTRSGASPTPQPPFEAVVWAAGQQPYIINAGQGVGPSGGYEYGWLVNLPVGGPYMISLYDSQGGTGGVSLAISASSLMSSFSLTLTRFYSPDRECVQHFDSKSCFVQSHRVYSGFTAIQSWQCNVRHPPS